MNILIWTIVGEIILFDGKDLSSSEIYFLCVVFSVVSEAEDEQVTLGDLSVENIAFGACFGRKQSSFVIGFFASQSELNWVKMIINAFEDLVQWFILQN